MQLLGVGYPLWQQVRTIASGTKHNLCLIFKTGIKFYLFQTGLGTGFKLFLSFCIQFCKQHVNIAFQHALVSAIEMKIMLTRDACSRLSITIKSHNLHADDIRRAVDEIVSYHERGTNSLLSLVPSGCMSFDLSLAFPFVFCAMVLAMRFFYWICCLYWFLFMCETRTETTLIYFLKLEPEFLYKSKESPIANNIIGSAG